VAEDGHKKKTRGNKNPQTTRPGEETFGLRGVTQTLTRGGGKETTGPGLRKGKKRKKRNPFNKVGNSKVKTHCQNSKAEKTQELKK